MKRRRVALWTGLAIAIASVCLSLWYSSSTKWRLPADAVGVRFVGAEAGRIALTNRTSKVLLVQFLAVQTKGTNDWIEVPLAIVSEVMPPHETVSKRINPAPSGEPWRIKMIAAEEITGGDRLMRATMRLAQESWGWLRGRKSGPNPSAFAAATRYWGHETVLFSPVFE